MFESVGDAGEHADLGVGGLDESLGEAVVEGGVDLGAVLHDAPLELDERRDAAATCPGDPAVDRVLAGLAFELECNSQTFLEQVGVMPTSA
jgi:hypothetical protein